MIGQPKRTDSSPYKEYKASNVDWTDSIPQHWNTQRLRNSLSSHTSGVWGADADGISDLPCLRVADFDRNQWRVRTDNPTTRAITQSERQGKVIRSGNLLLEKSGGGEKQPVGTVVLYDHELEATCSNFIEKLVVAESHDPRFLKYVHSTLYGLGVNRRSIKQTTGIQNIDLNSYLSEKFPFPPPEEQAAIARFLDHTDEKIKRYIAGKERLIALLEEERQALVHQAVTRGLDPSVRLKPSGVEWMGEVPEHWDVRRLRYLIQDKLKYGANAPAEFDEPDWPRYLRITDFTEEGRLREDNIRALPPEVADDYLVEPGDILLARSGATVGKAFLVPSNTRRMCHAGYLIRARAEQSVIDPRFLFTFTQSHIFDRWRRANLIISTIENISAEKYADLPVPTPTISEQREILEHLDGETYRIDKASQETQRIINLLQEYRTRLIADVVTGQLDVRETAAQLQEAPSAALSRTELRNE